MLARRIGVALAASVLLAGCAAPTSRSVTAAPTASVDRSKGVVEPIGPPSSDPTSSAAHSAALLAASALTVKGRGSLTDYSRKQFGTRWLDTDRNGCDTRNDILRRDLQSVILKPDTRGCAVLSGVLRSPYTDTLVTYVRGHSRVDIDHVVALGDAWQKGAARWSPDTRRAFANDPLNLLAVDMSSNRQKGDGDTATWLPKNKSFRCSYVARQVAV